MFQYATGRRLAHKWCVDLKLDITGFGVCGDRKYSLGIFNFQGIFACPGEVAALTVRRRGIVESVLEQMLRRRSHIREKHFHFNPRVLKLSDNVYLEGYWQSEKYFIDIAHILRHEFTMKSSQTNRNKELTDKITSVESVSLHIRRGDYLNNSDMNQFHRTCDLGYYYRCVEYLSSKVKNPYFFIFSDDPEWVRDNLKLPHPTILVDYNGVDKDYEDLRLMTYCKYHIIANSTFSWWGAWLCTNSDKIVIAPKQWFGNLDLNTRDLVPITWHRI